MQTFDGASVMCGHISGAQHLLHEDYPFAYFFHLASYIRAVKVFFANLPAFCPFTSMSSKRKKLYRKHGIEIPQPGDMQCFYCSHTVGVIFEQYQSLLTALQSMVENPQHWGDVTLSMPIGIVQHLIGFLFHFLIALFNKILQQSSILYIYTHKILQNVNQILAMTLGRYLVFLTSLVS